MLETLADDCLFTEGPVWNPEGYYLFSDITANTIYRIIPGRKKELFLENSGTSDADDPLIKRDQAGSNGLGYDRNGDLLICRHGAHAVARYDGKQIAHLVDQFKGRPLNSPNDLIVHSDGRIYFSDPPYGLKDGKLMPENFHKVAGVYCRKGEELELVCDRYQYPNGVCLSPDEKTLYICSNKPFEAFISMYDTGTHIYKGVFAEENSDGIETDPEGRIYLCNKDGIIVLDQRGERVALIRLPAIPANICWGGAERKDLLITARQYVFLIRGFLT